MNIHLKNKSEFEILNKSTLISIEVGSSLYGLNNEKSDKDILNLVTESNQDLNSFIWSHHQLQYKENDIDYLYCSLKNFIRNILSGDSTINYEVLFSDAFKHDKDFSFLYNFRNNFGNYNILRSYLGLARRDIKLYKKDKNVKKLHHAYRGLWAFDQILKGEYSNNIREKDNQAYELLKDIKNGVLNGKDSLALSNELSLTVESLRSDLNKKLESKQIDKMMSVENMIILDEWLINFSQSDRYVSSKNESKLKIKELYDSLQSDIKYHD